MLQQIDRIILTPSSMSARPLMHKALVQYKSITMNASMLTSVIHNCESKGLWDIPHAEFRCERCPEHSSKSRQTLRTTYEQTSDLTSAGKVMYGRKYATMLTMNRNTGETGFAWCSIGPITSTPEKGVLPARVQYVKAIAPP
jgi:hypothetical protein